MTNEQLIKQARQRIEDAYTADLPHRELAESDLKFLIGDGQWHEEDRAEREKAGKPCLTFNRMPQFVRKVTAQIRNMNPAIRITAADSAASDDTAKVIEGLIRQIEAQSEASSVYEGAAESAAACGIGHWRVLTQYCEGLTFDQEIIIRPIKNPFAVLWDPFAREATREDARFCFVLEDLPKADFEAQYPKAKLSDVADHNTPSGARLWSRGEKVTIAEYYWIEPKRIKIGLTADGQVIEDPRPPMEFVAERTVEVPQVKWAKITRDEVLEGPQDVPGRYIPVIATTGEEWHIGEQMYRSSVIRYAKDAQVLYNFSRTTGAEIMGNQTKAPWLVTPKQIAGAETLWASANENLPYLPYNPDPGAPPPQRIQPAVPSSAVMSEIQLAADDMKATTGIYDASLGAKSNETSGVAIAQRQQESESSTSSYADNMMKAISHTGRVIVAMLPAVYDTARTVRILGRNDEEELVAINQVMVTMGQQVQMHDLSAGRYDVRIAVGPTYQTKREESAQGMLEFMRTLPQAAPLVADLVAGMQDWPDADRVAARLKKTLPPGFEDAEQAGHEQMQQQQMMMAQQQQAMEMQQQAAMLELREKEARAIQAEAQAQKTQAEAQKAAIELAMMTGQYLPEPTGAPMGGVGPMGL